MNRRHILGLATGLGLTTSKVAFAAPPGFVMSDAPKAMPELQFTDGEEKPLTLADFKGKIILFNIWATWCAPCRKEMPTLDRLQAALSGPDFVVLPMSIDRKGMDAVTKFYTEIGIQHLARYVAPAANQVLDTLGVWGLPATLLVDRQGRELGRLEGPAEWDSPEMIGFLKAVIAAAAETVPLTNQKETTP